MFAEFNLELDEWISCQDFEKPWREKIAVNKLANLSGLTQSIIHR